MIKRRSPATLNIPLRVVRVVAPPPSRSPRMLRIFLQNLNNTLFLYNCRSTATSIPPLSTRQEHMLRGPKKNCTTKLIEEGRSNTDTCPQPSTECPNHPGELTPFSVYIHFCLSLLVIQQEALQRTNLKCTRCCRYKSALDSRQTISHNHAPAIHSRHLPSPKMITVRPGADTTGRKKKWDIKGTPAPGTHCLDGLEYCAWPTAARVL